MNRAPSGGALEALRQLGLRSWQDLVVSEAAHVADLEAVDRHPVEAGKSSVPA